ncbi:MAG: hypothetical protein JRC77_03305 [Deltaproteobacteria bacterium]|nr:hypothetical protein [Deltaproteobacteria bacterium]
MGEVRCEHCNKEWDAQEAPLCPGCLQTTWLACETLVRRKHDPRSLPHIYSAYRSVVTEHFLEEMDSFLAYSAQHGSWYYLPEFETYNHFTVLPLGLNPGAGIPAGQEDPDHALDCLVVAEANEDPHVFAVELQMADDWIEAGEWIPLENCGDDGCGNLRVPGERACVFHGHPQRASRP